MRLNLLLLVLVVLCALAVVSSNHQARRLYMEHEREVNRGRDLEVEWGQLQLEQGTWAAPQRIDKLARQRLGLQQPVPQQIVVLPSGVP